MKNEKNGLSNPNKKLWPKVTKRQLYQYLHDIAPHMLPFLERRPLSFVRFPNGIHEEGFFQKTVPAYYPEYIQRIEVGDEEDDTKYYAGVASAEGLLYLGNQAVIEFHIPVTRYPEGAEPRADIVVWDIDPAPENTFADVLEATRLVKTMLDQLGLGSWPKLTGSKGVHIMVPLVPEYDANSVKIFARKVCGYLAREFPDFLTVEFRKDKRKGRVLLDYMRNSLKHTFIAPYSPRAKENTAVSMPVTWEMLAQPRLKPDGFGFKKALDFLKDNPDPLSGFFAQPKSLAPALKLVQKLKK